MNLSFLRRLQRSAPPVVTPGLRTLPEGSRFYGDGGTIHGTTGLDVEIFRGEVVSVWFRCSLVPFEVHEVDEGRAQSMREAYADYPPAGLSGLVFREDRDAD